MGYSFLSKLLASVVCTATSVCAYSLEPSQSKQQPSAQEASYQLKLNDAVEDLARRATPTLTQEQLSYREHLADKNGNTLTRYYDASLPKGEKWLLLEKTGEDISQSQLQIEVPILLTPSLISQRNPRFHDENEQFWIYAITPSVRADSETQDASTIEKATNRLQSHLNAFLYISKKTQQFARLKIVNSSAFSPSTLAQIDVFSIVVNYAAPWPSGPLVAINSERTLKGSYGFFIKIDEYQTQQLSLYKVKQGN